MKTRSSRFFRAASIPFALLASGAVLTAAPAPTQRPRPASAPPQQTEPATPVALTALPLEKLLWREVRNREGKPLGMVGDVLAQMPSGRIIYLSITPAGAYRRPKVVPPGIVSVPADQRAPLQINITAERWREAPVVDWNDAMVVNSSDQGAQVYAFYEQNWLEPPPGVNGTVNLSANVPDPAKAERYVSLHQLLDQRVITKKNEQTGYLSGFLIDWPAHRVTHALVAPKFPPVPKPDEQWFAVPVALLTPPNQENAMQVNADTAAFNQAPTAPAPDQLPSADSTRIYRYPAAQAVRVVAAE